MLWISRSDENSSAAPLSRSFCGTRRFRGSGVVPRIASIAAQEDRERFTAWFEAARLLRAVVEELAPIEEVATPHETQILCRANCELRWNLRAAERSIAQSRDRGQHPQIRGF